MNIIYIVVVCVTTFHYNFKVNPTQKKIDSVDYEYTVFTKKDEAINYAKGTRKNIDNYILFGTSNIHKETTSVEIWKAKVISKNSLKIIPEKIEMEEMK